MAALFVILLWLGLIFAMPGLLMLLWNAVVPLLFHGPEISYWIAFALMLLINIFLRPSVSVTRK